MLKILVSVSLNFSKYRYDKIRYLYPCGRVAFQIYFFLILIQKILLKKHTHTSTQKYPKLHLLSIHLFLYFLVIVVCFLICMTTQLNSTRAAIRKVYHQSNNANIQIGKILLQNMENSILIRRRLGIALLIMLALAKYYRKYYYKLHYVNTFNQKLTK